MFNRDLSKGSAELLVLTLLEARPAGSKKPASGGAVATA
jgi:hypothetical protein